MPFIACWPDRIQPGTSDALISQVDPLASFADLTRQGFNTVEAPDSRNVLPAWLGESPLGRESLVEHARAVALRQGDWKFIPPGRTRDQLGPSTTVQIPKPGFLFNLARDPGETNHLAGIHPDKLDTLAARLEGICGRMASAG